MTDAARPMEEPADDPESERPPSDGGSGGVGCVLWGSKYGMRSPGPTPRKKSE